MNRKLLISRGLTVKILKFSSDLVKRYLVITCPIGWHLRTIELAI